MKTAITEREAQILALEALFDGVVILDANLLPVADSNRAGDQFARFALHENSPLRQLIQGCFRGEPFEGLWSGLRAGDNLDSRAWNVRGVPIRDDQGRIELVAVAFQKRVGDVEPLAVVRRQLHEYESVFLRMKQGVWRVDEAGRIINVNPYLAAWLELNPTEMAGHLADEFVKETFPSADVQQSSISERFEARFSSPRGVNRSVIVVRTRLRHPDGEPNGWIDVITDITSEHAVQARLMQEVQRMANLASVDALTGLANRRTFDLLLASYLENASSRPFGLLVLDLDGLKEVNDTYGHEAGDLMLAEFARRLKTGLRTTDHVARLGGDEFACIIPEVSPAEFADAVQRCKEVCQFEIEVGGSRVTAKASIGCVHSEQNKTEMLATADRQMYQTKLHRRGK